MFSGEKDIIKKYEILEWKNTMNEMKKIMQ